MSVTSYKFVFHLRLGKLSLSTSFQCDISATWKRSSEVAKSELVQFSNGAANFNQTISLPVNMYFDSNTNSFQEKKVNPITFRLNSHLHCIPPKETSQQELLWLTWPLCSIIRCNSLRTSWLLISVLIRMPRFKSMWLVRKRGKVHRVRFQEWGRVWVNH